VLLIVEVLPLVWRVEHIDQEYFKLFISEFVGVVPHTLYFELLVVETLSYVVESIVLIKDFEGLYVKSFPVAKINL
jgi:hypothetical protein